MESAETSPAAPQDAATTNATAARVVISHDGVASGSASRTSHGAVPRRSRALFEIDPGWPFVVAGLGLIVAGVLIPAQRDLHELRGSLEVHRALLEHSDRRLDAYDRFLVSVDEAEPQLVRRLAASQLNKMPADERPYLMLPSMNATVSDWIDASEPLEVPSPAAYPDTLLSRLATGPRRLWILASGVFLIFVGLVFGPSGARRVPRAPLPRGSSSRTRDESSNLDAVGSVAAIGAATLAAAPSSMALGGRLSEDVAQLEQHDVARMDAIAESALEPATELATELATEPATALAEDAMFARVGPTEVVSELAQTEACGEQVEVFEVFEVAEVVEVVEVAEVVDAAATVTAVDTIAGSEVAEQPSLATSDTELTSEQVVTEVALIGHETSIDDEVNVAVDGEANASETASSDDEVMQSEEVLDSEEALDASEADELASDDLEADDLEADDLEADDLEADDLEADDLEADELASENVACDEDEPGDTDESVELRAETIALPGEQELTADAERPDAFDRALDTWSLFHGIDESRWIDTSDRQND
jgi:hypothetical protein